MADTKKVQKPVLKPLLSYARPYIGLFGISMLLAVITVATTLYAPILIGQGVDLIVGEKNVDFGALVPIIIKLCITVSLTALSQWLMSLCTNKITFNVVRDIRRKAFAKLGRLPLSYIDSHPHGDIISRIITDIDQISDGLLMGFAQLFTGICTIIGTIVFMLTINVKISLVVILLTPLSLFVARFIAKNTFDLFRKQSIARGEMTSLVEEITGDLKTVQAFGYEDEGEARFEVCNSKLQEVSVKAIFFSSLTNPYTTSRHRVSVLSILAGACFGRESLRPMPLLPETMDLPMKRVPTTKMRSHKTKSGLCPPSVRMRAALIPLTLPRNKRHRPSPILRRPSCERWKPQENWWRTMSCAMPSRRMAS